MHRHVDSRSVTSFVIFSCTAGKKGSVGKSKEELTLEKRRELERRLQDVSGQLNSVKKPAKPKGEFMCTTGTFLMS